MMRTTSTQEIFTLSMSHMTTFFTLLCLKASRAVEPSPPPIMNTVLGLQIQHTVFITTLLLLQPNNHCIASRENTLTNSLHQKIGKSCQTSRATTHSERLTWRDTEKQDGQGSRGRQTHPLQQIGACHPAGGPVTMLK